MTTQQRVICGDRFGPNTRGQTGTLTGEFVLDSPMVAWDKGFDNDVAGKTLAVPAGWFKPGWVESLEKEG